VNLTGILDNHFTDNNLPPSSIPLQIEVENDDEDEDDDDPLVERIQTEDGRVQDVHVYQVYLLGMSGTGKCSLLRQFKTTEYRGIYNYSSSIGKYKQKKHRERRKNRSLIADGNDIYIQML
jgi:hypothetical protein